jgi:S-adenosylmethionine synthetase
MRTWAQFDYNSDETVDWCQHLANFIAVRLGKRLTDVSNSGELWWLKPDGKACVNGNEVLVHVVFAYAWSDCYCCRCCR